MAITVGSRELKNRLGKYLRIVREGTTVLVTDRGKLVAELRPVPAARSDLDAQLDALAARGLIGRSKRRFEPRLEEAPLRIEGPQLSETIAEDREDRL